MSTVDILDTAKEASSATDEQIAEKIAELKAQEPVQENVQETQSTDQPVVRETVEETNVQPGASGEAPAENAEFAFDKDSYKDKKPEELIAELEKVQKQVFHKEQFIKKQSEEVGTTRKEIAQIAQTKKSLEQQLATLQEQAKTIYDDVEAKENLKQQAHVENNLESVTQRESSILFEQQIRSQLPEVDDLINTTVPDIVRAMAKANGKDDYAAENYVSYFKTGQWRNAGDQEADIVRDVFNRASYQYEIVKRDQKIAELQKNGTNQAQNVAANIRKVAQQNPVSTNSQPANNNVTVTPSELAKMSDDQFMEIGKKLGRVK